MLYKYIYNSKIGKLYFLSDGQYLYQIILERDKDNVKKILQYKENNNIKIFKLLKEWFDMYFNGEIPNIKIPFKLRGTSFQNEVWNILYTIPYGKTMTYKDIANIIKEKNNLVNMSCQAVGNAVGKNPLLVLIPCHRVLGSNNTLKGFSVGLDIKEKLLEIENIKYKK